VWVHPKWDEHHDLAHPPEPDDVRRAEHLPIEQAVGRIAAELITPYPPGVPALAPGEVLNEEVLDYLRSGVSAGMMIPDASDAQLDTIRVVTSRAPSPASSNGQDRTVRGVHLDPGEVGPGDHLEMAVQSPDHRAHEPWAALVVTVVPEQGADVAAVDQHGLDAQYRLARTPCRS
jgi:hypothetical protein